MVNKIGINCHGENVRNKPLLFERLKKLKPTAVLVLDSLALAREIKALLPDTTVIYRQFEHGEKIHEKYNPEQWLDNHASHGEGGVVIHVGNEMQFDRPVMDWLLRVCNRAVTKDVTVCIGNWAVGNPEPDAWPIARELLKFASEHRDNVIVGIHEYAGGVITSGLIGGYPDNAGVEPGKSGGINLIQPEMWPNTLVRNRLVDIVELPIACYHMGRYWFLIDYCKSIGIEPPRIIVTEAGFDDTSDIKPYLETLKKTAPYQNIRGWKTLINQWAEWYGARGWSADRAYAEQMIYSDKVYYTNSAIEGRCVYCYGHSSDEWIAFDLEDAVEFWDVVIKYANEATQEAAPVFPLPDEFKLSAENASGENYKLRLIDKIDDTPQLGFIKVGERFYWIDRPGEPFIWGKNFSGIVGYVSREVLNVEHKPLPEPPPLPHLDFAIMFRQHREIYSLFIEETKRELQPLLDEKHTLDNKVNHLQKRIEAFEMLLGDYDIIEEFVNRRIA